MSVVLYLRGKLDKSFAALNQSAAAQEHFRDVAARTNKRFSADEITSAAKRLADITEQLSRIAADTAKLAAQLKQPEPDEPWKRGEPPTPFSVDRNPTKWWQRGDDSPPGSAA